MRTNVVTMIGIALLLSATLVPATAVEGLRVNIPFQFMVGKAILPAGHYSIIRSTDDLAVRVVGEGKEPSADAMVLTRLAGDIHTTPKDAQVVFDKIGDKYILSEVWIPGTDGYLLSATKEKHEHKVVNSPY
jgi:hypothetical protein